MRIYANCLEMHNEVNRDIHELGTIVKPKTMQDKRVEGNEAYETIELSPYDFMIIDGTDRTDLLERLKLNAQWAREEFEERITGPHNPGTAWRRRADVWDEFIHDGKFAYTYSERFMRDVGPVTTALSHVITLLRNDPDTRQAILPIFDARDDLPNAGGRARIPCSIYYQFAIRRNQLNMFYTMRSSDFATHFAYDIWLALEMQHLVSGVLGVEKGKFTFFTGSLHIYRKDWDQSTF